jgi:8-amino-7-oxononanoate synthase
VKLNSSALADDEPGAPGAGSGAPTVVDGVFDAEVMVGGRTLSNFTSAHYLGFSAPTEHRPGRRPSGAASSAQARSQSWRLALGAPRALAVERSVLELEAELAKWTGSAAAFVGVSAFQVLCSLLEGIAAARGVIAIDERTYALARLATDLAKARGARVVTYPHNDPRGLLGALRACAGRKRGAVAVVCDSWSFPGRLCPLGALARVCALEGAQLIVDDTQMMGLLGERNAGGASPLGNGGAGTARHLGVDYARLIVVASLSKAFGVPLAFAAGAESSIAPLAIGILARASSPPDLASVRRARDLLVLNRLRGEHQRDRLLRAVAFLKSAVRTRGPAWSPVQHWEVPSAAHAARLWARLWQGGVWALPPARIDASTKHYVQLLVTAQHDGPVLARAIDRIRRATSGGSS